MTVKKQVSFQEPEVRIDVAVRKSEFAQESAKKPLRICCYGSSSSKTPEKYLQEARHLGYLLAKRGHTCVNGAGSYGCMAAMNDGCAKGNGHIVGVIHEMWLVDDPSSVGETELRDGGAHPVFDKSDIPQSHGGPHKALQKNEMKTDGPIREMLVAGGKDLQERKRLLVDNADALVVLPGGPGTWDELWEMACARNIGLTKLPIVCVNIEGYYDPFKQMLEKAYKDELTKMAPSEIVHFEDTAEDAVRWVEWAQDQQGPSVQLKKRSAIMRKSSFYTMPVVAELSTSRSFQTSISRSFSQVGDWVDAVVGEKEVPQLIGGAMLFAVGLTAGFLLAEQRAGRMG